MHQHYRALQFSSYLTGNIMHQHYRNTRLLLFRNKIALYFESDAECFKSSHNVRAELRVPEYYMRCFPRSKHSAVNC
jgi:hypothetical protein